MKKIYISKTTPDKPYHILEDELIEQAAHWHALIQSCEMSELAQKEFDAWNENKENSAAYQQMSIMWQQIDNIEVTLAKSTLENVLSEQKSTEHQTKKGTRATFTSVLLFVLALSTGSYLMNVDNKLSSYLRSGYIFADYHTAIGEDRVITLNDNTRVHLNTFSAINVQYTNKQRTIELLQGEIHIEVAKDTNRPLVVITDHGTSRALGTQFIVQQRYNTTEVTVTESVVEVCATMHTIDRCQQIKAGQQTYMNTSSVLTPREINKQFIHHWSQQLLIVENQPVLNVLDELNRYHRGYIKIDRRSLTNYVVSGVFPLNDLTKSLQVLEGSIAIQVKSYTPLFTVIKAK